jgi:hypothetical protein
VTMATATEVFATAAGVNAKVMLGMSWMGTGWIRAGGAVGTTWTMGYIMGEEVSVSTAWC